MGKLRVDNQRRAVVECLASILGRCRAFYGEVMSLLSWYYNQKRFEGSTSCNVIYRVEGSTSCNVIY
eukprot:scaffold100859_cov38-Prasinocladus_malaysianus.AAC.1